MNSRRGSLLGAYSRTTTINGRAHASMIESTKRTTKPRRVIRTTPINNNNTTPINNNTPTRVIRTKPVINNNNTRPVIRNNNTRPVIRNNNTNPKYTPSRRTVTPTRTTTPKRGGGTKRN
jgi:hypothetical protein|tara:strand:- start:479 stop:838 length:360 start_codon:yes stop_codon:yes gene_type:complete